MRFKVYDDIAAAAAKVAEDNGAGDGGAPENESLSGSLNFNVVCPKVCERRRGV